jgi:hypothetical protein
MKSRYLANKTLEHIFTSSPYEKPWVHIWMALLEEPPDHNGENWVELEGGGYNRVGIRPYMGSASYHLSKDRYFYNTYGIAYPRATEDWKPIKGLALFEKSEGGDLLWSTSFGHDPFIVPEDHVFGWAIGQLVFWYPSFPEKVSSWKNRKRFPTFQDRIFEGERILKNNTNTVYSYSKDFGDYFREDLWNLYKPELIQDMSVGLYYDSLNSDNQHIEVEGNWELYDDGVDLTKQWLRLNGTSSSTEYIKVLFDKPSESYFLQGYIHVPSGSGTGHLKAGLEIEDGHRKFVYTLRADVDSRLAHAENNSSLQGAFLYNTSLTNEKWVEIHITKNLAYPSRYTSSIYIDQEFYLSQYLDQTHTLASTIETAITVGSLVEDGTADIRLRELSFGWLKPKTPSFTGIVTKMVGSDLKALYPLSDDRGTELSDASGRGNHGSFDSGIVFQDKLAPTLYYKSAFFPSELIKAHYTKTADLDLAHQEGGTIFAWIKMGNPDIDGEHIIWGNTESETDVGVSFSFDNRSSLGLNRRRLRLRVTNGVGDSVNAYSDDSAITDSDIHFVAVTYGLGQDPSFYVDGGPYGTDLNLEVYPLGTATHNFQTRFEGGSHLQYLSYVHRIMSQSEIQALYRKGRGLGE